MKKSLSFRPVKGQKPLHLLPFPALRVMVLFDSLESRTGAKRLTFNSYIRSCSCAVYVRTCFTFVLYARTKDRCEVLLCTALRLIYNVVLGG